MCGLTGIWDFEARTSQGELEHAAQRMAAAIAHRGPDDWGVWSDPAAGLALGHRRLSIIDLSPLGHQPMHSPSGRYAIVFNGEIYNYRELRDTLCAKGHVFRSQSDTEVLLAAVEEWGVAGALPKLNAMFAIALWDKQEQELFLARDRFGEKPLYYGRVGNTLLFGSELKALCAHAAFEREIDRGSLTQFLRFTYVPAPRTIFKGVDKLPPGSWRSFRRGGGGQPVTKYWSLIDTALAGAAARRERSDAEAIAELDGLLRASIKARMVSDVPLGAFLSGGIDSSTVVALMQAESSTPVRTFTIGFHEAGYNEAVAAEAVARHLGTEHTELYVTPAEAQAVIPRLPALYDEPFADSSQIPTFLVSELARRHVTVALSGDGGDELLGGYNRYFWAESVWRPIAPLPLAAREALSRGLMLASPATVDRWFARIAPLLPRGLRQRLPGDKVQKLAEVLRVRTPDELYFGLVSTWKRPTELTGVSEPAHAVFADAPRLRDFTERMMCIDTVTYLPDDILVKVDRASMGVSLEGRIPLLDPDLAAFAWSLPKHQRIRNGVGKWILREVLARYVPRSLFERPKMGFGVPIDAWLRGPLRGWADSLLGERRLRDDGFFQAAPIRAKWNEHVAGARNWQYYLWPVLMFQAWLDEYGRDRRAPSADTSTSLRAAGALGQPQ